MNVIKAIKEETVNSDYENENKSVEGNAIYQKLGNVEEKALDPNSCFDKPRGLPVPRVHYICTGHCCW